MRHATRKALTEVLDEEELDRAREHLKPRFDLLRAEALRELAVAARDEALARERAAFDAKWTWFLKCQGCGARVEPVLPPYPCACGSRVIITSGYTRTT